MAVFDKGKLKKLKKEKEIVKKHTVMVVDDEEKHLESMANLLKEDYHIITAHDGQKALDLIHGMEHPEELSVIISDQRMPKLTGEKLFEHIKDIIPTTIRIILTGYSDKEVIIDSINKAKLHGFVLKPFEPEELKLRVKRAVETFELQRELDDYRSKLEHMVDERTKELMETRKQLTQTEKVVSKLHETLNAKTLEYDDYFKTNIITKSKNMEIVFRRVEAIAEFNAPVLITGETGTGKELIARAIHHIYKTKNEENGKFVGVNVGGWDEQLFDDKLFGHKKGAFTGAFCDRSGLLEEAKDGTIFFDEIGDLALPLQKKLLRIIQEKTFFPIGSDEPKTTNARFVFATNRKINESKEGGTFRGDLFYRIEAHTIHLLPLRDRKDDIEPLLEYFVKKASEEFKKDIPAIPDELVPLLLNYNFPGNVRGLRNMVFNAVNLHQPEDEELLLDVFIEKIGINNFDIVVEEVTDKNESIILFIGTFPKFNKMKKIYAKQAMKLTGTKQDAADLCGIDRASLSKYLKGE